MNDTRFLRCLTAASHATVGRDFPEPSARALIAVVRAVMAEVDAYDRGEPPPEACHIGLGSLEDPVGVASGRVQRRGIDPFEGEDFWHG